MPAYAPCKSYTVREWAFLFCDFTGIRINNLCRITSPVNLDLLACFPRNVHGSTAFLLVLLNVSKRSTCCFGV